MIYAVVTEYMEGQTAVQYINQKAVPASKTNPFFLAFVDKRGNALYIEYAQAVYTERKHHLVDRGLLTILLDGVKTVTAHNTDEIGGKYDPTPIRIYYPE